MLDNVIALFRGEDALDLRVAELRGLRDRDLADLGIARDQIEEFVRTRFQPCR